jgi:hypothetical protein
MKIYLQVQNSRVIGLGETRSADTDIEFTVNDDHEVLKNPFVFTYANGQLTKDEVFQEQQIQEKEEQRNKPTVDQQLALMQKALDDIILGVM